ncbi:MAG: hypothetical protein B7Z55_09865 [Planctomycetales bacterium 12-60-4]|nr:MAG: hypothetical protein B7Z55_09865 [Planctomycetales bacterium 12-60-4]
MFASFISVEPAIAIANGESVVRGLIDQRLPLVRSEPERRLSLPAVRGYIHRCEQKADESARWLSGVGAESGRLLRQELEER